MGLCWVSWVVPHSAEKADVPEHPLVRSCLAFSLKNSCQENKVDFSGSHILGSCYLGMLASGVKLEWDVVKFWCGGRDGICSARKGTEKVCMLTYQELGLAHLAPEASLLSLAEKLKKLVTFVTLAGGLGGLLFQAVPPQGPSGETEQPVLGYHS